MAALSHRQRVLMALNHQEPDRVPMDLSGVYPASINVTAYARLVDYLGLRAEVGPIQADLTRQQLSFPADVVLRRLDTDCRPLYPSRSERTPEVWLDEHTVRDEWGISWERSDEGEAFFPAPAPFQGQEPTIAELEQYAFVDPRDPTRLEGLRERARRLHEETDYAVVLNVEFGIMKYASMLRGYAEFLEDLLINPGLAQAMLEHGLAVVGGLIEFCLEEAGEYVDIVHFPDDLGSQDRPMMSPSLYRKMVKPYHRRLVDIVKRKNVKVLMHSDGAVFPLIGDLIDAGFDALNPVQVSSKGMGDTSKLKAEFGKHLTFWGAIDTHHVLPAGSVDDVRQEVRQRIADLAPGGGYVVAAVQSIQADVSPQNIVAMFDAAHELGRYESLGVPASLRR